MRARDIFGIIVRAFGVLVLLYGLWYLAFGLAFAMRVVHDTGREVFMGAYFASGIAGLVAGAVLLRFGRHIVRFSYPSEKDDAEA